MCFKRESLFLSLLWIKYSYMLAILRKKKEKKNSYKLFRLLFSGTHIAFYGTLCLYVTAVVSNQLDGDVNCIELRRDSIETLNVPTCVLMYVYGTHSVSIDRISSTTYIHWFCASARHLRHINDETFGWDAHRVIH